MKGFIYCLTSPSGKKYIGQCINIEKRMNRYKCLDCKKQPKIYRALCKYGFDKFKLEIVEEVEQNLLNYKEKFYIEKYDTMKSGYNCTTGGDHFIMSEETKRKMSKSRSGSKNPFFGRTHTEETKKILREKSKKQMEKENPFQGKTHTEETKRKLRDLRLGIPLSLECKKKLSKAFSGDKNYFSKNYKIVSPEKEIFFIKGTLKQFVAQKQLSLECVKKFMDKGIIPEPKNIKHNRMSNERINTTGWIFSRV